MFQGGDSDNWETDEEDEGYEYVIDEVEPPPPEDAQIKPPPPTLQVAAPTSPVPIRPPRTKQKSPTASQSPCKIGNVSSS